MIKFICYENVKSMTTILLSNIPLIFYFRSDFKVKAENLMLYVSVIKESEKEEDIYITPHSRIQAATLTNMVYSWGKSFRPFYPSNTPWKTWTFQKEYYPCTENTTRLHRTKPMFALTC